MLRLSDFRILLGLSPIIILEHESILSYRIRYPIAEKLQFSTQQEI